MRNWIARNRYTAAFATVLVVMAGGGVLAGCDDDIEAAINATLTAFGCDFRTPFIPAPNHDLAPMSFERNLGQADPKYPYIAQGKRHAILISAGEVVFSMPGSKKTQPEKIVARLEGGRVDANVSALQPLSGRVNYLIGNDSKKWVTDIPTYGRIHFSQVYPGIDVEYHGAGGYVENDFIVAPGADASAINIAFEGTDNLQVLSDGSLEISARKKKLQWNKPVIYQEDAQGKRKPIEGRYRLGRSNRVQFELGYYDQSRPLVIDPTMTYATYFGTANTEGIARVASDASGNAYVIGGTNAGSFGVTPGTFYTQSSALMGDVMLAKVAPDGKTMIFTTHIGGGDTDQGLGITLDSAGNIYLAGFTFSADFPHTTDLTTKSIVPNGNCFVTKLPPSGNAVTWSTLMGGTEQDVCGGIAVDATGSVVVVGASCSTDFPTTPNAVQKTLHTTPAAEYTSDPIIMKLSPDGTKLTYATYFGGNSPDVAVAVASDAAGNAYVAGFTLSPDFPVSSNAYQSTYGGRGGELISLTDSGDAWVAKFNPSGAVVYSTFLGGRKDDLASSIVIDAQGNAYIGGYTLSSDFPVQNAFQATYGGAGGESRMAGGDGFIAELDPTGSSLLFSSYLGGSADDRVTSIAFDPQGNLWVAGQTLSNNFPVTPDAPQSVNAGDDGGGISMVKFGDAFLAEIVNRKIAFATLLGGSSADWAGGVAPDAAGGVIIAGGTTSKNLPVSAGAYQSKYGGIDLSFPTGDGFIARYGGSVSGVSIGGVANAASFASGGVAAGEVILVAGTKIGPTNLAGAALGSNGRLATQVAGARFLFDGVPAPIVYTSSAYSSVIVPYAVAGKTSTQLVAEFNGQQSPPVTIPVVAAAPGIFTSDVSGHGQAQAYNADLTLNSATNPAQRGKVIVLFLTGEGQTAPGGVDGQITGAVIQPTQSVIVSFGGVQASDYKFIGEVPGITAGVLQVNVTVPDSAPTGNVQLTVTVGSVQSQSNLTVAIQ